MVKKNIIIGIASIILLGGFYYFVNNSHTSEKNNIKTDVTDFANKTISGETRNGVENNKVKSVVDSVSPADTASLDKVCGGSNLNNFDCYDTFFKDVVAKEGIPQAFAILKSAYQENPYVVAQCHPLTHVIGNAASEKFSSVSEAYLNGDPFCWSGYYHGVMEGIIDKIGPENLPTEMNKICAPLAEKRKYSFDHYNCAHGLGHGVMAISNDELFQSIKMCDNLSDPWERESCWSGVFMENVIVDNKNHFTKYLKPDEPLYPCNAVAVEYKGTCYLMQTSYMLKVTGEDFKKVFALCDGVEEAYKDTCYQSLGRDASGHSSSNVDITKTTCELGQDNRQKSNCIVGAVKDFISYFHGDTEAKNFCAAFSEKDLQDICTSTRESYVQVL